MIERSRPPALWAVKWVLGPLVVVLLSARWGQFRAEARRAQAFGAPANLSQAARTALSVAAARAAANGAWALGSVDSVKDASKFELDQLPPQGTGSPADTARRVQLLLRFGIVDTNPDGQAAIFGQVCMTDPQVCEHLKDAAERETRTRLVAPGNHLPLYFVPGHVHVPSM